MPALAIVLAASLVASRRTVPPVLRYWKEQATLQRAVELLAAFRFEQSEPARFYGLLARDTVTLISSLWNARKLAAHASAEEVASAHPEGKGGALHGALILDVGGGPGYFGVAFSQAGAQYYTCEPDVGEMSAAGIHLQSSVRGSGLDLPFRNDAFDITYSSNVAEHVPDPWRMADEMIRVTAPGGMVILSYTCWLGPFGGHETGLWQHYVGGEFAARRYARVHGHEPKNRWGTTLFNVSCSDGLRYAHKVSAGECAKVDFIAAFPRYHPQWAWWMVKVPVLREFSVSNLVLVFQVKG